MILKRSLCVLLAFLLLVCCALPAVAAKPSSAAELTTNGNGGRTDVGTWYITYNTKSMWSNNFGSGYPIKYRSLMPDGSYGVPDSADTDVIDFHLEQLAAAKIDFILFDLTNGGLTDQIKYGDGNIWIVDNAKLTCQRIALWNRTHDWKLRYAVAVGTYAQLSAGAPTGWAAEVQAEGVWNAFYLNEEYGGDNYYQVDGKPLLILHDWSRSAMEEYENYYGDKTYSSRFFVRSGQSGEPGTYGWQTSYGTLVHEEVMLVNPGQNTAGPGDPNVPRESGEYYRRSWQTVLDNASPRFLMIAAFNDYNEGTAVFTADTTACDPAVEEQWIDTNGNFNPSMYWDMTCEGIARMRLKNGDNFEGLQQAVDGSKNWFVSAESESSAPISTVLLVVVIAVAVLIVGAVVLVIVLLRKSRR